MGYHIWQNKKRGDNHQSIKPETDEKLVENIMKGFIGRLQPINTKAPPDDAFDHVINLKLTKDENSSLNNVKTIINELAKNTQIWYHLNLTRVL